MRRLTGTIIGAVGLLAGIVGVIVDLPFLGLVGGVAALAAGLVAFASSANAEAAEAAASNAAAAADQARQQLAAATGDLDDERRQHDLTRQALAEQSEPAAGSFGRKFDETQGVIPVVSSNPTDTRLLADPETNLFSEAYFRVALDARIASARRHLRPVAVALVEVVEGSGAPGSPDADATKVTGSIRQTLRDADTACRMADGCFALILEDTPENGAVWTVERIRRNLTSRFGQHTMWAGVACYPAHAFSTDELLDQASLALESAREWKQDRIEVATAD